ncbi:hypothetical protein Scep_004642 [Stephania cephalantha]|uniref:Uncharacterized protein n=1 Tax=Stephania cephalantha TaxID=152367 RepID=A0AAP0KST9_9MAGN
MTPPASSRRMGKHLKVETKPAVSLPPGLIRLRQCLGKKRKFSVSIFTPFDRMGCGTEAGVAYQQNLSISRRLVEKGPNKDKGGEGDGVEKMRVMIRMRSRGYGHCDSIEGREAVTSPVERVKRVNVEYTQNETKLFPTCTMGAFLSQQSSDLLRSFLDELKATVDRLDRIKNFLISLDGRVQHINGAISKIGGDVGAGMQTIHKDMSTLLKKAVELRKKVEASRKIMKEFIDRLDPMVEECDRALKDRSARKKRKNKYQPSKGNHG